MYTIYDWAGNKPFGDVEFRTFDDAWEFIYLKLPDALDEDFEDYHVDIYTE